MADRKRSHVWLYFSCTDSSDAMCDVCGKTVKYSGNTTNLAKHLRLNHKSEYDDIMKRRSEEEVQGEKTPRAAALTRSLGEMIVRDLQPMSVVEDEGFQAFVKALDPRYKLPSRKKMTETYLVNMFDECKDKVRATLQNAPSVVLTTDMWTSVSTEAYLTVTCHVIENWQTKDFVLETAIFHGHTKATEKLRAVQQQMQIAEHKLIQSVETRWNSVFYMLDRLHEQHEAVTTVLCLLGRSELCINVGELSLITQTVDALRPFEEMTREVSSEKYVSVSKVIPLVSLLQRACKHQGSSVATQLAQQCQRRFAGIETNHSLAASTFLDARFKHLGFQDKNNAEGMKNDFPLMPSSQSPELASDSAATKVGLWADFDTQVASSQHHRSATTDVIIEMRRYSEEKLIPRDKEDPLVWWQEHHQTFPGLSKLAVKYLGIVATSVPAERMFSKAGEVVSKKRNRLKGKTVNMLLFLNKNL
ncbi:zinc finger BED domain-containing protein 4-like [Xyrauchen texanus]|uniref:zinc finger BED domain-containing protein 4-like n=1 Tax=Xyrauchen texanus TaxID=154827 RepID=UPI002242A66C|nr:zinc finger BED domain-containing protein 4-like [Xyrauchen texanus]